MSMADWVAERFWPTDPDRDSAEADALMEFYRRADEEDMAEALLVELAEGLPNTRRAS